MCQSAGWLRPRHEFADIVAPSSSPGRMARRHPDRTASHHRYPPAPPIRPRPTSTPASPQAEPRWVSNRAEQPGRVRVARGPRADICGRRRGNHQRTHCEPRMQSAVRSTSGVSHRRYANILIEPWLSVHRQWSLPALRSRVTANRALDAPTRASHVRPPDLRTVSCRADAA